MAGGSFEDVYPALAGLPVHVRQRLMLSQARNPGMFAIEARQALALHEQELRQRAADEARSRRLLERAVDTSRAITDADKAALLDLSAFDDSTRRRLLALQGNDPIAYSVALGIARDKAKK